MSNEKVRLLLEKLQAELQVTELDDKTRDMVRALEADVEALEESDRPESLLEQAQQLEAKFASKHPVAERVVQEIVELLGKMGV